MSAVSYHPSRRSQRFSMRLLLLLLTLPMLAACSSVATHRDPKIKLAQFKRFYVEQRLNDNFATAEMIAADLRDRGYTAAAGPTTLMPDDTQVLINYDAQWSWDFHSYLMDLEIVARNAHSLAIYSSGHFHHPGLTPKQPAVMVHALLDDLLK